MRAVVCRVPGWGRFLVFSTLFLFVRQASAGDSDVPLAQAPKPAWEVTWPDIARAVDRHPGLAAGALRVDAARAGIRAAGAVPNPSLEGELGGASPSAGGDSEITWGLSLTIPLGWIAQRGALERVASAEADVCEAEAESLRREVLLELRILFIELAHAQASTQSLEALEKQTAALVETVHRRVAAGDSRPAEATRVEIELERVTAKLESARVELSARRAELALWVGAPSDREIVAVADLNSLPSAMDREAALSKAREGHPALAAARERTRAGEARLDAERRARVPSISIKGFTSHELDSQNTGAGVAIDLPLWNWNTGRVARARAELASERMEADYRLFELEASVLRAQAACQASTEAAARFGGSIVPRAESAASTIEKTYAVGEASLLEVIDARRTLLESHSLHLDALAQAHIDCSRLGSLVGEVPR